MTERITDPINIKFSLQVDDRTPPRVIERVVHLENIPGAWAIHGEENEGKVPGYGASLEDAALDFIANNYGGKKTPTPEIVGALVQGWLQTASKEDLNNVTSILLELLCSFR